LIGKGSAAFLLLAALVASAVSAGSAAAAPGRVSSNWAGYAVTGAGSGSTDVPAEFTSVSGTWVVPKATCTGENPSFAAFWVGLGGFATDAGSLEQIGTETDCDATGAVSNYAWYELLPAPPVQLKLKIAPGDVVWAAVSVSRTRVSLLIKNVTRHTTSSRQLSKASPDLSSAEWIVEAPSSCNPYRGCRPLPLTNFGTVSFSKASTTANGHAGPISDPAWSTTAVQLGGSNAAAAYFGSRWRWQGERRISSLPGAVPAALAAHGSSFSVSWRQAAGSAPTRRPPVPRPGDPYSA